MNYRHFAMAEAELTETPKHPDVISAGAGTAAANDWNDAFDRWFEAAEAKKNAVVPCKKQLMRFAERSTRTLLAGHEVSAGFIYSPVNLWLCLSMLSRMTDGTARAQIDGLLECGRPEEQIRAVWKALYWDDGAAACLPAMSVWLNEGMLISEQLLNSLADQMHTSVFRGRMGTPAYDEGLRTWLSEQTRGLLDGTISGLQLLPDNGISVCAALYLRAAWSDQFPEEDTRPGVFRGRKGDVTAEFMHGRCESAVYRGGGFLAVWKEFAEGGGVFFILPEEELTPAELLGRADVYRLLPGGDSVREENGVLVNLALPRLDCMTELPLTEGLKRLGITGLFGKNSVECFPDITSASKPSLSSLHQHIRLVLDENGAEAAAMTVLNALGLPGEPEKTMDFVLDRPFAFAVMNENGIPLFIGCINDLSQTVG